MPFSQARKTNFNALRNLNLEQRIEAISDPRMGQFLISMLSPTQAAELFPKYYIERNQNISGFLKAIPSSLSAAKQKEYEQQLQNTASGESAGANYNAGGYRKKWQENVDAQRVTVSKKGVTPPPQLSPEQKAAFDALKAGDIDINDDRMKWLKNAPKEVLKEVGISTVKDDKGNEKFHYTAPQVSEEEARKSMISKPGEDSARKSAESYLGRQMSDHEWSLLLSTTKAEATSHKGETAMVMATILNRARSGNWGGHSIEEVVSAKNQFSSWMNGTARQEPTEKRKLSMYESATMLSGISHRQTEFASASVAAYNTSTDGGGGERKIRERLARGFTQVGGQIFNAASESTIKSNVVSPDPITQNYTPQQIAARQQQMQVEAEAGRLGKLAGITQPDGPVNAAGPVKYDGAMPNVKVDYEKSMSRCGIGVRHIAEQMYGSKYFQGGLGGPASTLSKGNSYLSNSGFFKNGHSASVDQLKDQSYLNSLPVGTVISAAGGNERGEGHVQIKIGPNSWASDFPQGNRVLTSRRDGREYHGYTVHEPTKDGLDRLNKMGFKQTVSDSDTQHLATSAASVAASTPREFDGPPVQSQPTQQNAQDIKPLNAADPQTASSDIKPLETVTQPQGPLNTPKAEALPAPAPAAPAPAPAAPAPAPEEPTATVQKPAEQPKPAAPTPERYNVNMSKFIGAIKQTDDFKNTPLSWMATDSMITDGFNKDPRVQAAGVRLDEKGVMHFTKGMTPEAKEAMATFDTKSFMTKIEDKKKEDTPTQVKPKAKGGTTKVSTEEIAAYPIGGLQGDNAVVVNAQQQPLFTMNTNEAAVMNPDTKTVDVIPNQKNKQVGPQQQPDSTPVMNEFNSAIQDLQKDFDNLSKKDMKQPDMTTTQPEQFNQSWLAALGHVTEIPYRNPTAHRVASRANGVETGSADNGYHFSHGNKS